LLLQTISLFLLLFSNLYFLDLCMKKCLYHLLFKIANYGCNIIYASVTHIIIDTKKSTLLEALSLCKIINESIFYFIILHDIFFRFKK
jgi:hypothetical protein